jgi:integrase
MWWVAQSDHPCQNGTPEMYRGTPHLKGWYNMAERPKKFPGLARGEGSWGYDEARRKIVLRHRWPLGGGGAAHVERGETFDECITRRNRRRRDLDVRVGLTGPETLGGLLELWFAHEATNKAARTRNGYLTTINHLHRELGTDTAPMALTVEALEEMGRRLVEERGLGTGSMAKRRCHLSMALSFAARRKMITPELHLELTLAEWPDMPPTTADKRWHDLAAFEKVRRHLVENRGVRNTLFAVMMLAGLRPGEALGLKREFVDGEARLLRVEGQIIEPHPLWTPVLKTDHLHDRAHRTVPMASDLALLLDDLPDRGEFYFVDDMELGPPRRAPGWTPKPSSGLITFSVMSDHAERICDRLRLPYVPPNGYRHTYASANLHHGMQPEQLAVLMGHLNTTEIMRTYGHLMKGMTPPDADRYLGTPQG